MSYLASYIDHTYLKPTATAAHIAQLCNEALQHDFAAVCVPPAFVEQAVSILKNTPIKVATVVGFPLGYQLSSTKLSETASLCQLGADEIDMVINIGWALDADCADKNSTEIAQLTQTVRQYNKKIKVIIETAVLTLPQIAHLCSICNHIGVDFVKTSTGFNGGGATPEVVAFMRQHLLPSVAIKASGGIQTAAQANALIAAGAQRLGTSSGVAIVSGGK